MYQTDLNYAICRASKSKYEEIYGTMVLASGDTIDLTLSDFVEGEAVTINSTNMFEKDILFGEVHANALTMSIRTDLDRYALFNATVTLTYKIYNKYPAEGVTTISSEVPLGIFTITNAKKNRKVATLTGYDNMKLLDVPSGTRVFSGTAYDVLSAVSEVTHVDFNYTATDMQQFLNYSEVVQFDATTGSKTCRDIVKYICQMLGVCCRANRTDGSMELYKFSLTPDATIPQSECHMNGTTIADYSCSFNGFSATSVKGTFKSVSQGIQGITMILDDAPAWDYGIPASLKARSVALADFIKQLTYTPCTLSLFNNPIYDCGDMLAISINNTTVNTLVTKWTWSFRRAMTVGSDGTNVLLEDKTIKDTDRKVSRSSATNKLVSYDVTNEDDITITTNETENLCDIAFNSAQETHCMWLANILVETEADSGSDYTDIKVTYTYDGNEIVFYPQEHYSDGNHTFSLFYPLSSVTEQSVHRWKVDITSLGGTVTILEDNFKGTLFGQNLVEQEYWDGILVLDDTVPAVGTVMSPITITESGIVATIFDPNDEEHKLWVISGLSDIVNSYSTPTTLITTTENCIITLKWAFSTVFCRSTNDASMDYAGSYLLI